MDFMVALKFYFHPEEDICRFFQWKPGLQVLSSMAKVMNNLANTMYMLVGWHILVFNAFSSVLAESDSAPALVLSKVQSILW